MASSKPKLQQAATSDKAGASAVTRVRPQTAVLKTQLNQLAFALTRL